MNYLEKLKDPRWIAKRSATIEKDEGKCRHCQSEDQLTVHHTYYAMGRELWEYDTDSLVTLCRECHYEVEKERENLHRSIASLNHHQIRWLAKNIGEIVGSYGFDDMAQIVRAGQIVHRKGIMSRVRENNIRRIGEIMEDVVVSMEYQAMNRIEHTRFEQRREE